MLRTCVMELQGSWDKHLPLMEFAYNNTFHSSLGMAPYEALYDRKCRTSIYWDEVGKRQLVGPEIMQLTNKENSVNSGSTKGSPRYTKELCRLEEATN